MEIHTWNIAMDGRCIRTPYCSHQTSIAYLLWSSAIRSDTTLCTVLLEISNILNFRPLTYLTEYPDDVLLTLNEWLFEIVVFYRVVQRRSLQYISSLCGNKSTKLWNNFGTNGAFRIYILEHNTHKLVFPFSQTNNTLRTSSRYSCSYRWEMSKKKQLETRSHHCIEYQC